MAIGNTVTHANRCCLQALPGVPKETGCGVQPRSVTPLHEHAANLIALGKRLQGRFVFLGNRAADQETGQHDDQRNGCRDRRQLNTDQEQHPDEQQCERRIGNRRDIGRRYGLTDDLRGAEQFKPQG